MAVVINISLKMMVMALLVMAGKRVGAQVHHVVGGDRGWDPSSDVASWSSGRSFAVGDKIWFAYSAAEESIIELNTKDEYESCDVSNPIRMYTDGLSGIPLDGEGARYFVSSKPDKCKNGLKLHVEVMPFRSPAETQKPKHSASVMAAAPTTPSPPSGSLQLQASLVLLLVGLCLSFVAF
ncbi:Plastocyanin-like protein [Corchorus capsularis]|uniref:Plastocyanin-like protein n=1 Tax=Corchorus capsularis TaxID=210143 RepID=A0A1R3I2Q5_COCAP|nr:Plastocyanin-like protein [Corchorus capsularis]